MHELWETWCGLNLLFLWNFFSSLLYVGLYIDIIFTLFLYQTHLDCKEKLYKGLPHADLYDTCFKENTATINYTVGANQRDLNRSLGIQIEVLDERFDEYINNDDDEVHHYLRDDLNLDHRGSRTGLSIVGLSW